jgi:hypothetical protein
MQRVRVFSGLADGLAETRRACLHRGPCRHASGYLPARVFVRDYDFAIGRQSRVVPNLRALGTGPRIALERLSGSGGFQYQGHDPIGFDWPALRRKSTPAFQHDERTSFSRGDNTSSKRPDRQNPSTHHRTRWACTAQRGLLSLPSSAHPGADRKCRSRNSPANLPLCKELL